MASATVAFDILARDQASAKFAKVGQAAEKDAGGGMVKFGAIAGAVGAGVTKALDLVGQAIGSVGEAFGEALDQEKSSDRLAASLGATPRVAEKYGRIASDLYKGAWGESMDDVNRAIEGVASSFQDLNRKADLKRVTRQALDFSSIFGVEVPRAAEVASVAVKSGLAKNATEAFDLMTKASQKVPVELREDVLDATEEYGQFFHTLGLDGEDAFGVLVKGAEKGMYGIDKAGDAIKEFTIRSTDMSTSSKDAYKAIGLDAGDMANAILKGGDTASEGFGKVVDGLLGIKDPAERANAAIALFGTPLEDLNVSEIPKFLRGLRDGGEEMGKFKGAIDEAGDTLNDNAATRMESFKRSVKQTFVEFIGGKVLPVVEDWSSVLKDKLGPTVQRLGGWFSNTLVPALSDLWDAFTKGKDGSDKIKAAMEEAEPFIRLTKGAFKALAVVIRDVVWPITKKWAEHYLPIVSTALGAVGEAGIALWNNALQPAFKAITTALGQLMTTWGAMLRTLGKVPGFGWAKNAGEAMSAAGREALGLADDIKKIPKNTDAKVNVTVYGFSDVNVLQGKLKDLAQGANVPISTYTSTKKRARGGPIAPGDVYTVGEEGPELFVSDRAGQIIPNDRMPQPARAGGSTSGGGVTIVVNTGVGDPGAIGSAVEKVLVQYQRDIGRPLEFQAS